MPEPRRDGGKTDSLAAFAVTSILRHSVECSSGHSPLTCAGRSVILKESGSCNSLSEGTGVDTNSNYKRESVKIRAIRVTLTSLGDRESKRKRQRRISEIDVAVRASGCNKSPVNEVAIPGVGADMTVELPV